MGVFPLLRKRKIYGCYCWRNTGFFEAVRDNSVVGIAVGNIVSSKIWPFSKYCNLASFPATPVANKESYIEKWLLERIEKELQKIGVYKVSFASYHSNNSKNLLKNCNYKVIPRNEYNFDLTGELDELYKNIKTNKRKQIKKAEKNNIQTIEVNSIEAIQLVEDLHNLSMDRRGVHKPTISKRIEAAQHYLLESGRVRVLISYLGDEVVCGDLLGVFNGQAYGLRAGSSKLGNKMCAPVHLRWTAIKRFKEQGLLSYSLGGAREDESGLIKFKLELGTIETKQPSGSKVISKKGLYLESIRAKLKTFSS